MAYRQTGRHQSFWEKIWRDANGDVVIFQKPNLPIISWAILATLSLLVRRGTTQQVFWYLSTASLIIWALLEVFKGANYFRRSLGLVILLLSIASLFNVGR